MPIQKYHQKLTEKKLSIYETLIRENYISFFDRRVIDEEPGIALAQFEMRIILILVLYFEITLQSESSQLRENTSFENSVG